MAISTLYFIGHTRTTHGNKQLTREGSRLGRVVESIDCDTIQRPRTIILVDIKKLTFVIGDSFEFLGSVGSDEFLNRANLPGSVGVKKGGNRTPRPLGIWHNPVNSALDNAIAHHL